jgi:ubiquinone biosynthesis protein
MRISSIPQIYRHLTRWREILAVLSKYGLADWIGRLGPEFAKDLLKDREGAAIARHTWPTRIRLAVAELGPTFIKLGQLLSTRPDLVGTELAAELQHLQDDVSADPMEQVRTTVEQDLGRSLEGCFAEFEPRPLASASIGQVHRARLKTGERVVVKVQHPDVPRKFQVDLDIFVGLSNWAEMIPELAVHRPRAIATEFQRTLRRELDFDRELRNMQEFARNFADDPTVRIPHPYPDLSGNRVITMDMVEGIKLAETQRLAAAGIDLNEVARRGANLFLKMIFANGFYHADPHPGNLMFMEGNVIGLLDYGMVGRIDERLLEDMEELFLAVTNLDAEHLTSVIIRVGAVPAELDRSSLSVDLADYIAHYGSQSLESLDLSSSLNELIDLIHRYRISLPARMAMLLKALVTLEGTGKLLSPRFSLLDVMKPYRKKMLLRRLSPGRQIRKLRRLSWDIRRLLDVLPRGLGEIVEQVQAGKFDVHLDHRGLEPSVNRLVLGMLASALFLGSSLMISRDVPPMLFGVSVLGATGMLMSIFLGLRLWRAINKSGHLDRRK